MTLESQLTSLDRTLTIVLAADAASASERKDQVPSDVENLHRLHGSSVLLEACQLLDVSCFPTAVILYHRCCHSTSLKEHSVWNIAMASTLLACKLEEIPMTARQVIVVYTHVHRRRYLQVECDIETSVRLLKHPGVAAASQVESLPKPHKLKLLEKVPSLSPVGPVYKEWHESLIKMEQVLLRKLGFVLYWIPENVAHRYLRGLLECFSLATNTDMASKSWS